MLRFHPPTPPTDPPLTVPRILWGPGCQFGKEGQADVLGRVGPGGGGGGGYLFNLSDFYMYERARRPLLLLSTVFVRPLNLVIQGSPEGTCLAAINQCLHKIGHTWPLKPH